MVNVGFWNVRGLNRVAKQSKIKWFMNKNKVDLFGLLETKIRNSGLSGVVSTIGNNWSYCTNHSYHPYGRVWVLWNHRVFEVLNVDGHAQVLHLHVKLMGTGVQFWISMVYEFNTAAERVSLWDNLCATARGISRPWMWCGDFNSVLGPEELIGAPVQLSEIRPFRECVKYCEVADCKAVGAYFTWNNKQPSGRRVFSRLDRVMHNGEWVMSFPDTVANFMP
ncbi:hypothetical protein RND81_05G034900 [Saponaria officinalis]|uniref:Endonuclease/exonuclease/phosphatase domain-containing protein n=1 Tax=Saponaria officinalis TaxID=3572 RepID=A0AAW1KTX8_SAPOF